MSIKLFDSRDPRYRSPFGAVSEGTKIHFRICLPRYFACTAATLMIHDELRGTDEVGNMFWCGMEGDDAEWWEVDYTPAHASLYFYWFKLDTQSSAKAIGRTWGGRGETSANPAPWQLTVYEKGYTTPDWLDGGIIYQIFPDSFCRSGKQHSGVPEDRHIQNWGEQPHWQPDEHGVIRNDHYFGGDLAGITSKLDYIRSLGVTCIYLNPIFEAHENHRYNTADYEKIDPLLGTQEDFKNLCEQAKKRGMRVVLDGVFSHTGADSRYFNKNKRYGDGGAFNDYDSPYRKWYNFKHWPNDYQSWWGIMTLPEVDENQHDYLEYITGEDGILRKWLRLGASGWRLDVADELPDLFLDRLREAVREEKHDGIVIGEVWEDASNKIAYSQRRRYLLGRQLDSVMNYCFKDAILGFVTGGIEAPAAMEWIMTILENYPPQTVSVLMNLLGTHDTMRIITTLAGESCWGKGREWQSQHSLSPEQFEHGVKRCRLAAVLLYTLPGVPSIYYGDEACVQGYCDPFNRACFPWEGRTDAQNEQIKWYRKLGAIRTSLDCFKGSDFSPVYADGRCMAYKRSGKNDSVFVAVNVGECDCAFMLDDDMQDAECLMGGYSGGSYLCVPANSAAILHSVKK